jgi:hypothetical protein
MNGVLSAAERNHYFYGLLMDAGRFQKDQRYMMQKLRLANRLVAGAGVVCGLDVTFDPSDSTIAVIKPGVAFDYAGREIVVPADVPFDPSQPTDDLGKPVGSPLAAGEVIVCLAYAEECSDLEPVLVPECGSPGDCQPSTVRETFRIVVKQSAGPPPTPIVCGFGGFPAAGKALQEALAKRITEGCTDSTKGGCIALARIPLPAGPIDVLHDRPLVYNNQILFELLVCLSTQLGLSAAAPLLQYFAGDGQTAVHNTTLPVAPEVVVTDSANNPLTGVAVQFQVTQGGGTVTATVNTNASGHAKTKWKLGPAGAQQVVAAAAGSLMKVTFTATST